MNLCPYILDSIDAEIPIITVRFSQNNKYDDLIKIMIRSWIRSLINRDYGKLGPEPICGD
jgi:hypothetical protein